MDRVNEGLQTNRIIDNNTSESGRFASPEFELPLVFNGRNADAASRTM